MRATPALTGIPHSFWRRVRRARHLVLMLDWDGTLTSLRVERARAVPSRRAFAALRKIAALPHMTLAIVSGRPLRELEPWVGTLNAERVGEHGWEHRVPGGRRVRYRLPGPAGAAFATAVRLAGALGLGGALERKRSAVVLHTRALGAARARAARARVLAVWEPLLTGGSMRLDRSAGGLELRARGHDKGSVVRRLHAAAPRRALGVFVGDDVTDEDAFEAVRTWGVGIKVGAPRRPTRARARLASVAEVERFLERWLAEVEGAGAG